MQLALGQSFLPRVACEHGLKELQSPLALRMIFHPLRPSISGSSPILLGRIAQAGRVSFYLRKLKKGSLPAESVPPLVVLCLDAQEKGWRDSLLSRLKIDPIPIVM